MLQLKRIFKKAWVQHLVFWVLSFLILTGGFATAWPVAKADFIYTLLFHVSLISAVYVHLLILVPGFLLQRKYWFYVPCVVVLVYLAVLLNEYSFTHFSDWLFPGFYFISDYTRGEIALFVGLYLLLSTSLKFSKSWLELQRTRLQLEATRRAHIETELMALRAQVNPHFLFNSLHSIYALALEQSNRTPDLILRLSNVLRFMLYEADKKSIRLDQEISCISEFIALQRARLPEEAVVNWDVKNACVDAHIAPLLLMPLVDNAFKHGSQGESTQIDFKLQCANGALVLRGQNQVARKTEGAALPGGIGLVNVQRRLNLMYPDRHSLEFGQRNNSYFVELKVQLS